MAQAHASGDSERRYRAWRRFETSAGGASSPAAIAIPDLRRLAGTLKMAGMSGSSMFDSRPELGVASLLTGLEAAGEITRLRLLHLLCGAELTVTELVAILGQSQPRVSRHLKLLTEAGLAERRREGAWAFFRLGEAGASVGLARDIVARIDPADPFIAADRARLDMTREARRRQAAAYFARMAADWDRIRALHASEERVEAALMTMIGDKPIRSLLDLGTGTGRMLELF